MNKTLFFIALVACGIATVCAQEAYGGFTATTYDAQMDPALDFAKTQLIQKVQTPNETTIQTGQIKLNNVSSKIVSGVIYRFNLTVLNATYNVDVWWQPWNNNFMKLVNFAKVNTKNTVEPTVVNNFGDRQ